MLKRYFVQSSWLSRHNIALSLCFGNRPFVKEVLTSLSLLPEEVAIEGLLLTRETKLKRFFTVASKSASSFLFGQAELWQCVNNQNRCNARQLASLKGLTYKRKTWDNSSQGRWADLCLCLYLSHRGAYAEIC